MSRCWHGLVSECMGAGMQGVRCRVSGYRYVAESGCRDFKVSGCQGVGVLGCQRVRIGECREPGCGVGCQGVVSGVRVSGCRHVRVSACQYDEYRGVRDHAYYIGEYRMSGVRVSDCSRFGMLRYWGVRVPAC